MVSLIDRQLRASLLLGLSAVVTLVVWVILDLREPVFGGGFLLLPASAVGGAVAGVFLSTFMGLPGTKGWISGCLAYVVATFIVGAIVGMMIFTASPTMGLAIGTKTALQIVLSWKVTPVWLAGGYLVHRYMVALVAGR